MVLTYHEAVEAAKVRAKTTRAFWAGSHFDVPHNAVDQFTDTIIDAVLAAVGYADLLAKAGATVALADYESACRNQARAEAERDALAATVARVEALLNRYHVVPRPELFAALHPEGGAKWNA